MPVSFTPVFEKQSNLNNEIQYNDFSYFGSVENQQKAMKDYISGLENLDKEKFSDEILSLLIQDFMETYVIDNIMKKDYDAIYDYFKMKFDSEEERQSVKINTSDKNIYSKIMNIKYFDETIADLYKDDDLNAMSYDVTKFYTKIVKNSDEKIKSEFKSSLDKLSNLENFGRIGKLMVEYMKTL